jgi:hypothetical protein
MTKDAEDDHDTDENLSELEHIVWPTADRIASEIREMLKNLPDTINYDDACEALAWALTRELPVLEKWASAHVAFEKIMEEYAATNTSPPTEKAKR